MADVKYDATGQQIEPRDITHVGGTAQTGRDLSPDLQVLTDLKKGAQNADAVVLETANVLKVLAQLQALNSTGTLDRLVQRLISGNLTTEQGLVVAAQLFGKAATGTHYPFNMNLCNADGMDATLNRLLTMASMMAFNETGFDRFRNNAEFTALASGARTATTTSADQTNHNAKGVLLTLRTTVVPGVDTIQLFVDIKDPASGQYNSLASFPSFGAAVDWKSYLVYPGAVLADTSLAGSVSLVIPRTWRARVNHSGVGSFTYSVGGCYIL